MRYAVVTLLVVLGTSLAAAGPSATQRGRTVAAADGAAAPRQAAAEPAAGDTSDQAEAQDKTIPDRKASDGKADTSDKAKTGEKDDGAATAAQPKRPKKISGGTMDSICLIMESAASANGLPLEFFARVIWQESRFQPDAVGPVTRSGHRAQGIAQFMPYTAQERGLLDPFNPVAALPKAAEFLRELRSRFGNLGLAAAAYNAGPRRVQDYLDGRGGMPGQTRHYVAAITGRTVDDWVNISRTGGRDAILKPASCQQLASLLTKQPSFFVGELERRVTEGKLRPWGVQLSAGFSRSKVLQAYARIERRYRGLLEKRDPMIIRTVLRSRGTNGFYQVRVGVDTRAAANRLCAALHAKGAACMVLKNSRGTPRLLSRSNNAAKKSAVVAKSTAAAPAEKDAKAAAKVEKRATRVRRAGEAKEDARNTKLMR
jgi:soluble lytic murein transglycosylase-like protein